MAGKISVGRFAERLGEAVRRYAVGQGVAQEHFAATGIYDLNSGRTYLDVAVDVPIDDTQWWRGIREEIRREFDGVAPDVTQLGLVVWQVDDLGMYLDRRIVGDEDYDLTELLSSHG